MVALNLTSILGNYVLRLLNIECSRFCCKNAGASESGFSFVGNPASNRSIFPNGSNSHNQPTTGNLDGEVEEGIKDALEGLF